MSGGHDEKNEFHQRTQVVRSGLECDEVTGAVVPPIHLTSTFAFRGFGDKRAYDYTRSGNPTRDLLAQRAGGAGGGRRCGGHVHRHVGDHAVRLSHSRGLAHRCASRLLRRHLSPVQRVESARRAQGGVRRFRRRDGRSRGAVAASRAAVDRDAQQSAAADHGHREGRGARARGWRARRRRQHVPVTSVAAAFEARRRPRRCTRPRNTSTGTATWSAARWSRRDKALHEQLTWWANCLGLTGAPFDSFLTLRGLRTLHARLDAHGRNALALAQWLQTQPVREEGLLPGPADPSGARAGPPSAERVSAQSLRSSWPAATTACARLSTGCAASRSPNRSAVWRASWRIRPR